jgi:lipoate-protein ligase A
LILDPPADGVWNLGVDEALLTCARSDGPFVLRFYRWRAATVSLGYFQSLKDRLRHRASLSCPVVRRPSGGAAIVHDREWTYSLIVPAAHWAARPARTFVLLVHRALVETLRELGWGDAHCAERRDQDRPAASSFLCFQRRQEGDVLVGGVKVAGSAQRKKSAALLQHGTLLLARSRSAPELAGLAELGRDPGDGTALGEAWRRRLAQELAVELTPSVLTAEEEETARRLAESKYAALDWTERRSPNGV